MFEVGDRVKVVVFRDSKVRKYFEDQPGTITRIDLETVQQVEVKFDLNIPWANQENRDTYYFESAVLDFVECCPLCERDNIRLADYLCEECRYGLAEDQAENNNPDDDPASPPEEVENGVQRIHDRAV
jgi:hypothetical protein